MDAPNVEWRPIPDFTEYGNVPKVIALARKTRSKFWMAAARKKRVSKRSNLVKDIDRVSRRFDVLRDEGWHLEVSVRKRGGFTIALAPRSPANHWLLSQGYQRFPF